MPASPRPVLKDIAIRAGVSPATVDRVINKRPGVRAVTARRVLQAAVELDYLPEDARREYLRPEPMRIVFLLPSGTNPYLRLLAETIKTINAMPAHDNLRIQAVFTNSFDPASLAQALHDYGSKADGIAFMAIDHPRVREAASALRGAGKHVVTIISDIASSSRNAYVGLDNRAIGRTAAHLLGRLAARHSGAVALIAGSRTYRAHEEREMGFLGLMDQACPELNVIGVREGHDNREENYRHTLKLLADYPDLVGIYNIGGSSDGIARALREQQRDRDIVFIGHGITPDTRALLVDDTMDVVITQNPQALIRNALQIFTNLRAGHSAESDVLPLTMEVIVRENLP